MGSTKTLPFWVVTCLLVLSGSLSVQARIMSRCEFATAIKPHLNTTAWARLGDWVCAAVRLSSLNTASNTTDPENHNSRSYGLFSANNLWWCHDDKSDTNPRFTNLCNASCSDFLDEDVADDVACALQVVDSKTPPFKAWWDWENSCQGKNLDEYSYLDNCAVTPQPTVPKILTTSDGPQSHRHGDSPLNITLEEGATDQYIYCRANGTPAPELSWDYDKNAFPELRPHAVRDEPVATIRLILPVVKLFYAGPYVCKAHNFFGNTKQTFNVHVKSKPKQDSGADPPKNSSTTTTTMYGLAVGLPLAAILFCFGAYYFWRERAHGSGWHRHDHGHGLTEPEIQEFMNGSGHDDLGPGNGNGNEVSLPAYENIDNQPYNKEYDIPKERLKFDITPKILGEGQYGFVTKAELDGTVVAVKAVKPNTDKLYIKALLSELKIMISLGRSQNVVNLIGAVTSGLRNGELLIVVEFCELGDLQNYLRGRKERRQRTIAFADYQNVSYATAKTNEDDHDDQIPETQLISWCHQIAMGMAYLESKKVIHGDLAARNVLLSIATSETGAEPVAKITDFGLSRQLYEYTNYVKKQQAPLPWRHMAIESLREMCFSTESDVWSFGVTMWEIFSEGDVPYAGRSWSLNFVHELEQGLRLLRPKDVPESMYEIMMATWNWNKYVRPSFKTLVAQLRENCEHQHGDSDE